MLSVSICNQSPFPCVRMLVSREITYARKRPYLPVELVAIVWFPKKECTPGALNSDTWLKHESEEGQTSGTHRHIVQVLKHLVAVLHVLNHIHHQHRVKGALLKAGKRLCAGLQVRCHTSGAFISSPRPHAMVYLNQHRGVLSLQQRTVLEARVLMSRFCDKQGLNHGHRR